MRGLRVIAGSARGHALAAPKGLETRPTMDRLKESFFNILAPDIPGARFLDLFSGSGAMGIEALSRGAREAVLVEFAVTAARIIHANLAKTKLSSSGTVLCMPVEKALRRLAAEDRCFDIIFMDPPYSGTGVCDTLTRLASEKGLWTPDTQIIAEMGAKDTPPDTLPFSIKRIQMYNTAQFVFYRPGPEAVAAQQEGTES